MTRRMRNSHPITRRSRELAADERAGSGAQPEHSTTTITTEQGNNDRSALPRGVPSTQSPQEFYAELTRRHDIQEILSELAKK